MKDILIVSGGSQGPAGASGGTATWGLVTGDIDDQTDLVNKLNSKENTSNKETSLSSNSDNKYPSVKAVRKATDDRLKIISSGVSDSYKIVVSNSSATPVKDAIEELMYWRASVNYPNVRAEIELSSGFVWTEQLVISAMDASFIDITSVDTTVYATTTGMVDTYTTVDTPPYMVLIKDRAKGPRICVQFENNNQPTAVVAFYVTHGSSLAFGAKSGARKFWTGLNVMNSSSAYLQMGDSVRFPTSSDYGVDFSESNRGVQVYHNSLADLPGSKFDDCTDSGVFVIWNSRGNFYSSTAKNAGAYGMGARDGSSICCRETEVTGSDIGYYAIHAGIIDARAHSTDGTGGKGNADNCRIAIHCGGGSTVVAPALYARNASFTSVRAYGGGRVWAENIDMSGSASAVIIEQGGAHVVLNSAKANNLTGRLCKTQESAILDLSNLESNSPSATSLAYIEAKGSLLININGADITCLNTIRIEESELKANFSSIVSGGITVFRGGKASLRSAVVRFRVAGEGGTVQPHNLTILDGSIVMANSISTTDSSSISCNLSNNTIDAHGILFGAL